MLIYEISTESNLQPDVYKLLQHNMRFNSLLAWTSYTALASAQELAAFLDSRDDLSSFRDALDRVPVLRDTLYSTQNITILAPTDAAFEPAAMSETRDILERKSSAVFREHLKDTTEFVSTISGLAAGGERLSELLQYHVLRGTWSNDTLYQWRAPVHTLFDNGLVTGGQIVLPAPTLDQVGLLSGSPALGVQRYSRLLETVLGQILAICDFSHLLIQAYRTSQTRLRASRFIQSTTSSTSH